MNRIVSKIASAGRALLNQLASIFEAFTPSAPGHEFKPDADMHIQALLLRLCGYDHDRMLWVMRWLAFPLRNPGARMSTALVVSGEQGCGKNLFFAEIMGKINDNRALLCHTPFSRYAFNDALKGKRYVVIDHDIEHRDIVWLKATMGSEHLTIDTKHRPRSIEKNALNFVLLTGENGNGWIQGNNRRFFVLEAAPRSPDHFYRAVDMEIANGGIEAFIKRLLHDVDMGDFCRHTPVPPIHSQSAA